MKVNAHEVWHGLTLIDTYEDHWDAINEAARFGGTVVGTFIDWLPGKCKECK